MPRLLLAAALIILVAGCSKAPSRSEFADTAQKAGTFEVESSKAAQTRATREDVKSFAGKMIKDHTAAGDQLKAAAVKDGVTLPASATLDDKPADKLRRLQEAKGEDFDSLYISEQRDAHDDAVSLFSKYSKNGEAGALKDFAAATLPVLEEHQSHIKSLPR
jgi:putative membrane protein